MSVHTNKIEMNVWFRCIFGDMLQLQFIFLVISQKKNNLNEFCSLN